LQTSRRNFTIAPMSQPATLRGVLKRKPVVAWDLHMSSMG
jgi:hypothetical protein